MRKVFLLLLFPFALGASAQSESGLWLGAEVDYDISARWSTDLELGGRLEDNFSTFTRYEAALGLQYKPLKWLRLGGGYNVIREHSAATAPNLVYKKDPESPDGIRYDSDGNPVVNGYNAEDAYWRTKHRAYFDLVEKWKVGRFGFSLRERYQFTYYAPVSDVEFKYRDELESKPGPGYTAPWAGAHADYLPAGVAPFAGPYVDAYGDAYYYGLTEIDGKKAKTKHNLRTRLAIDYNIRRCPVTPFVNYELYNDIGDAFSIARHRLSAGVDWKLTRDKRHALSFAYLYQREPQDGYATNLHVLNIGYKFSLESARAKAQKKAAKKKAKK